MAELVRHHPTDSGYRDHRGRRMCRCGSWWEDSIHDVRAQDPEVTAIEQRRVGERPWHWEDDTL